MIDLQYLERSYFWVDKPVPYKICDKKQIEIHPIKVKDSELFLSWIDILNIDKNSIPNPKYISMSYLDFILQVLILSKEKNSPIFAQKLCNILALCLNWVDDSIDVQYLRPNDPILIYKDQKINSKYFEDIRRIILYQNILDFDDSYINPDVKKVIEEQEMLQAKQYAVPNLERKIAIISSHTGITKQEQLNMTYRSHCLLFKEVVEEVEFSTIRTGVLVGNMFSEKKIDIDDWIYKRNRGKFEKYFVSEQQYSASMGNSIAGVSDNNKL